MSVARYQFALNAENPKVVKAGLVELIQNILNDCDVSNSILSNQPFQDMVFSDLLKNIGVNSLIVQQFFESSPQLQEFFSLLDLLIERNDEILCNLLFRCFALFLSCSGVQKLSLKSISFRLLQSYSSLLIQQLSSKTVYLRSSAWILLIVCLQNKALFTESFCSFLAQTCFMRNNNQKFSLDTNSDLSNAEKELCRGSISEDTLSLLCFTVILDSDLFQTFSPTSPTILHSFLLKSKFIDTSKELACFLDGIYFLLVRHSSLLQSLNIVFDKVALSSLLGIESPSIVAFLIKLVDFITTETPNGKFKFFFYESLYEHLNPVLTETHKEVRIPSEIASSSFSIRSSKSYFVQILLFFGLRLENLS